MHTKACPKGSVRDSSGDCRNYRKETAWENSPEQVAHRVARNAARREMMRAGKVHKGDRMEVDHKRPLKKGGSNKPSNLQVISRHANRVKGAK
jgi:5-methylcytosine-specific restriction endonuclease McrA